MCLSLVGRLASNQSNYGNDSVRAKDALAKVIIGRFKNDQPCAAATPAIAVRIQSWPSVDGVRGSKQGQFTREDEFAGQ